MWCKMKKIAYLIPLFSICMAIHGAELSKRFDWGTILATPPGTDLRHGNQILHFKAVNKPYSEDETSVAFVNKYLSQAKVLHSDAEAIRFASDQVTLEGTYIELGVCSGRTISFIAALNPYKKIYGFDSFEGFPEEWVRPDYKFPKGTFAFKTPEVLPPVVHNVEIIRGWFAETLPEFHKSHKEEPIAFLHVDCCLYSSTVTAFEALGDRIGPGTIILFDEFYNYPNAEENEFRAFQEFLEKRGFKADYLAFNDMHEQVVVKILAR